MTVKCPEWRFLADWMVGFDLFNDDSTGSYFTQEEAWEAREICIDSVCVALERATE